MKRYKIKEAFILKSANSKVMQIGSFYTTDDAEQIAELERFAKDGSVEEIKPAQKEEKKDKKADVTPPNPEEDITIVPGIGKTAKEKLAALTPPVTTLSELQAALEREDVKEALGINHAKVSKHFSKE